MTNIQRHHLQSTNQIQSDSNHGNGRTLMSPLPPQLWRIFMCQFQTAKAPPSSLDFVQRAKIPLL